MPVIPRLQVNDTTGRRVVPIDKPIFRIGRRGESDLRVVGGDVSREHAEIELDGTGRCTLRDRGSELDGTRNVEASGLGNSIARRIRRSAIFRRTHRGELSSTRFTEIA